MENEKIKVSKKALSFMKKHKRIERACEILASSINVDNDKLIFSLIANKMQKSRKFETKFWNIIYTDNPHTLGKHLTYNNTKKEVAINASAVSSTKDLFGLLKSKLVNAKNFELAASLGEIEVKFNELKSEKI